MERETCLAQEWNISVFFLARAACENRAAFSEPSVCRQLLPSLGLARELQEQPGLAAPLLSPGCDAAACACPLPVIDGNLGRATCTAGSLTAPATKYRGMPCYPKIPALQVLPAVSVEEDPSDPAQVSAACCPPSGCAAPVPGLFMSSQQANTGVTSSC